MRIILIVTKKEIFNLDRKNILIIKNKNLSLVFLIKY